MSSGTLRQYALDGQYVVTFSRLDDSPSSTASLNMGMGETPPLTTSRSSATPSPLMLTPNIPGFQPIIEIQSSPYNTSPNNTPEHLVPPPPSPVCETHPILVLTSFSDRETSLFLWNLVADPTSIRARHAPQPQPQYAVPYTLTEAATNPYMRAISIMYPAVPIPLKIDIPASNGHFVTVHDVLHCIYRHLRIPLTRQEYEEIEGKVDSEYLEAIIQAYEARYRAIEGDDAVRQLEKQKGLKRIDMLTNQTLFTGLAPTGKPDEFIMRTDPL